MLRLTTALLAASLLGMSPTPVVAQDQLSPPWFGGRVEVPEHGFAVVVPDGWVAFDVSGDMDEQYSSAEARLDGDVDRFAGQVGAARQRGLQLMVMPVTMDASCYFQPLPRALANASLAELGGDMYVSYANDPTITEVRPPEHVELPAGSAIYVAVTFPDQEMATWVIQGEASFAVVCAGFEAPDDHWLSIAKTFEVLPEEGPALAQGSFGAWPSVESCEPWMRPGPQSGGEVETRRGMALIDHLRDPGSSYELAFRSRNARSGGVFADGEQLDVDVQVVTADAVGNALIDGADYLTFTALANGPWSLAEMRLEGDVRRRFPVADLSWHSGAVADATVLRLPDVLANANAATAVAAPAGQDGHWYALQTTVDMGPGVMWDTTKEVFPFLRDTAAELFIEVDDDGIPIAACLNQSWWQGLEVVGEEATMLSAIRFASYGSAPPLPPVSWPSDYQRTAALGLELPVPHDGESRWDGESLQVWLDDEDELPHLRVNRSRLPDEVLGYLRELPVEQALEILALKDATDAKAGWNRDPLTTEFARIGGADGEASVPARLLTFHPEIDTLGTILAIDVVAYVDPWAYVFQYMAPIDNELAGRYLLERTLEGTRFLCSQDDGGACPPVVD